MLTVSPLFGLSFRNKGSEFLLTAPRSDTDGSPIPGQGNRPTGPEYEERSRDMSVPYSKSGPRSYVQEAYDSKAGGSLGV